MFGHPKVRLRCLAPQSLRDGARAFTLVELLAVIAIVGVLAALVLTGISKVRQSARASACQSNLRQMGLAVLIHAAEQRTLPGPLYGRVFPAIQKNNAKGRLAAFLAPRFDTITLNNEVVMVPVMVCPGFAAERPDLLEVSNADRAIVYAINSRTNLLPDYTGTVWGSPDAAAPRNAPVLLNSLPSPAGTWMLTDIDAPLVKAWNYSGWSADDMSPVPVHGSKRNRVYFDGHVAAVPLDAPQ
jgi:prepilin-type N-terminal cleavage/methylation domain-containing protein/prepilin-type processing-associated H-X9-DG protein